jgi:hypothetical protein
VSPDPGTEREIVLICGSRNWTEPEAIRSRIRELDQQIIIVHGNAPGVDRWAARWATSLGLHTARVSARHSAWASACVSARHSARDSARDSAWAILTRDLIGTTHGYTQEHHDLLMEPWNRVMAA